jgi:hypothetical protein
MRSFENGIINPQANYDGYVQINILNKPFHGYEAGMSNGLTQVSTIEGKQNESSMMMDY